MNKSLLLYLFLVTVNSTVVGQPLNTIHADDSLVLVLQNAKEDSNKITLLDLLSKSLDKKGYFNKAMNYALQEKSLAEKLGLKKRLAFSYNNIGIIFREQGNYSEALNNHTAALKIYQEINDREDIANSYIFIGSIDGQRGDYTEALKNFYTSLKITEGTNYKQSIAHAYRNIGNINLVQNNLDEALKNYLASIKISQEISDKESIGNAYNNIGIIYENQYNYPEAIKNYLLSLRIAEERSDNLSIGNAYNNIGNVYLEQDNYPEALKNFSASLKIKEMIGDKLGLASVYIGFGRLYTKLNKPSLAKNYLQKALNLSEILGSKEGIKDSYLAFIDLDSITNDFKEAFKYQTLYFEIKNHLLNEESNKQIANLRIQYESDKKDEQIKTQELQNGILQTRIFYGVIVSLMVIGIIVLLFYLFYLWNKKKKKEYEHMLTDMELTLLKSRLSPHFIANSLINIKSFISKQPENVDQFLSKFARLMRRVLEQNEQQFTTLREELETAELYMQIEIVKLKHGFDYHFEYDESIDQDAVLVPPLILQPIVENAIWHGLIYKEGRGNIRVKIFVENDLLKFTVEDNGVGQEIKLESENVRIDKKKSFGLSITRKRIEILNKEFKSKGYFNLIFAKGQTNAEMALPLIHL